MSGDSSIGIYSNADATKNVVNNGELTLSGKKTLGVFLRGGQTFENKANINIADSANSLEPTIGIYTAEGTSNIKTYNRNNRKFGEKINRYLFKKLLQVLKWMVERYMLKTKV